MLSHWLDNAVALVTILTKHRAIIISKEKKNMQIKATPTVAFQEMNSIWIFISQFYEEIESNGISGV